MGLRCCCAAWKPRWDRGRSRAMDGSFGGNGAQRHQVRGWGVGPGRVVGRSRTKVRGLSSMSGAETRTAIEAESGTARVTVPGALVCLDRRSPVWTVDGSSGSRWGRVALGSRRVRAIWAGRRRWAYVLMATEKGGRQKWTKKGRWPKVMGLSFDQALPTVLQVGRRASRVCHAYTPRSRSHSEVAARPLVACSAGGSGGSRGSQPH